MILGLILTQDDNISQYAGYFSGKILIGTRKQAGCFSNKILKGDKLTNRS